ncbi:hypothetical protein I3F58_22895 [Streptomyces sp. MUM 203J]|uniref:hypothetical protein n=1 Tax=Streptomyces sp. MUM 203J TaxID=2791990 RepID=UPI001F041E10|nr:hypothetical protein [Streptomyces sp. MUM 203J]MCH0542346.1 hypothetical protein [Streptomyces sp. MUM 203J]
MGTRRNSETRVLADVGAGRVVAAFASLGAAAIHVASAADHYAEWWLAGVFFYAVGAFQAGWAMAALWASGRGVMLLGLLANAGVIAMWAVSRTTGIPVGPGAGVPEEITRVGVTAVAFELVICLVAVWRLWRRASRGFASSLQAVLLVGAAGAAVTGMTLPAVEGAMSHSHSHGTAEESAPHDDDGHHDGEGAGGGESHEPQEPHPGSDGAEGAESSPAPSAQEPDTPKTSTEPAGDGHDDEPHGH